jgi:hypothetical protein
MNEINFQKALKEIREWGIYQLEEPEKRGVSTGDERMLLLVNMIDTLTDNYFKYETIGKTQEEDLIKDINKLEVFIIEDKDKEEDFEEAFFIKRRLVDLFDMEYPPKVLDIKKFRCKNKFADMFVIRLRS